MIRSRAALGASALALATAAILIPVYAHEGHGKPTGATFDPNAPKRVSEATALAIGLETAEVDFGNVEDVVRLTGMVRAQPGSLAAVSATYAGVVRAIEAQVGDRVRKGDLIAEVESPELAGALFDVRRLESESERLSAEQKRATAQIASLEIESPAAELSASLAEAEVDRLKSAGESVSANLLAQRRAEAIRLRADASLRKVALEQARTEAVSLQRQLDATRASAEALRATLPSDSANPAAGVIRLVAPLDGVVVSRTGVIGEGVAAGSPIVSIGDFSTVQIEGELPESLLSRVKGVPGAKVRIRRGMAVPSDVVAEGVVRFLSPVIDATKRTAHVIVDVDNPQGLLRHGQFVDLNVVISTNDSAVVVPATAVVKEGPLQYVFVREGKGENVVFKKRDVAVGVRDDRVVEITSGLVPGDVVAVGGAFSLSQLRGFVPGAPEPVAEPAKPGDGHGHSH